MLVGCRKSLMASRPSWNSWQICTTCPGKHPHKPAGNSMRWVRLQCVCVARRHACLVYASGWSRTRRHASTCLCVNQYLYGVQHSADMKLCKYLWTQCFTESLAWKIGKGLLPLPAASRMMQRSSCLLNSPVLAHYITAPSQAMDKVMFNSVLTHIKELEPQMKRMCVEREPTCFILRTSCLCQGLKPSRAPLCHKLEMGQSTT